EPAELDLTPARRSPVSMVRCVCEIHRRTEMTKADYLELLLLLSALELWGASAEPRLPDYLEDQLSVLIAKLSDAVLEQI
ncbi:MAG: hypothetical protein ACKOW0_00670, partial [Schleiferiaceae bacterium]